MTAHLSRLWLFVPLVSAPMLPRTGEARQADTSATDSLLEFAREAQRDFEAFRISRFPMVFARSGAGCDETIGRFCHWEDEDEDWEPPPEHPEVQPRRDSLLTTLRHARDEIPDDPWVVGQLVRYEVESGRAEEALDAANGCEAEFWWCAALRGFVNHHAGRFAEAEEEFTLALANMQRARRCAWTDLEQLLDGDLQDLYGELSCAQRDTVEKVVWWLADPMYIVEGNDRWTEHMTRRVWNDLIMDAASPFGVPWQLDLREILVRFGWPTGWERSRMPTSGINISSRGSARARTFIPPSAALLEDIGTLGPEDWPLDVERARSVYLPAYADRVAQLPHQSAVFLRGDSIIVVAAYGAPDTVGAIDAGLVLAIGGASSETVLYLPDAPLEGDFITGGSAESQILSLEVMAHDSSYAGRARYGVEPPSLNPLGFGVSDVLVFEPRAELPENPNAAAFLALHELRVTEGSEIGLYWEIYGLESAGEAVPVEISLERQDRGFFRGLFESIGIAGRRGPAVELEWRDNAGETTRVFPRSVTLSLADAEAGEYAIRLSVGSGGGGVVVETPLEIVEER